MTGVIFQRRIMTPGYYSMGVIIRRYTGNESVFIWIFVHLWNPIYGVYILVEVSF